MTTELPNFVANTTPPFTIPGLILPPLHDKFTAAGVCRFREVAIHIGLDSTFRKIWTGNLRAWLERGFSIRHHNGKIILSQWLLKTPDGLTLTSVGAERLAALGAPQQQALNLTQREIMLDLAELPYGLESKLRPYQIEPTRQLYRALRCGRDEWGYPGGVDLSDMGVGKTYMDLAAALAMGKRVGVLCPSVGQQGWQNAFAHFGAEPLFISTYDAVRGAWRENIATMDADGKFTWLNAKDMVLILDEAQACFPAGTNIETEHGPLPIEYIVETRIDTRVMSFDVNNSQCRLMPITNWFRNKPDTLIKIYHEFGDIICTPNHKLWTETGWIEAKNLTTNHFLRVLPYAIPHEPKIAKILQPDLRGQGKSRQVSGNDAEIWREHDPISATSQRPTDANLQTVREDIQGMAVSEATVLQSAMRQRPSSIDGIGDQADRSAQSYVVEKNDTEKPDDERDLSPQDAKVLNRQDILSQGRQWEIDAAANQTGYRIESSNGARDLHHSRSEEDIQIPSQSLQGRLGGTIPEASHRSGWQYPQTEEVEILGSEKDGCSCLSRVDRVEILESGSGHGLTEDSGNCALYDIEVEGTHCYFANGVLVHNCRHDNTLTVRCCSAAIRQGIPIIVASATMAVSVLEMRFAGRITGLHQGGDDWHRFLRDHGCVKTGESWKWDRKSHHLARIPQRLFPRRGIRVRKEEAGEECPETIIEVLIIDHPECAQIAADWQETKRMIEQLSQQMNGKELAIKIKQARMHIWHKCERLMIPAIIQKTKEEIAAGNSVAIFVNFTDCRERIQQALGTKAGFYGGQNKKIRQHWEREFQANREHVLVSNIGAGGASVSLHDIHDERPRVSIICATDNVVQFTQATGRVDRVGSKSISRQYLPCLRGAYTEEVIQRTRRKMMRLDAINDGHTTNGAKF